MSGRAWARVSTRISTRVSAQAWARAWVSTFQVALRLRFLDRLSLTRFGLLLGLCAMLVPAPDAGYAILNINGLAPRMSASTGLLAAAVVLNAVFIAGYGLLLDVGCGRDGRSGMARLLAVQAVGARLLVLARWAANLVYALALAAIALMMLSTTLYARYAALPSGQAVVMFIGLVVPALVVAAVLGMALDLALPSHPLLRSATALVVWTALTVFSVLGVLDLLGIAALRGSLGDVHAADSLSFGLISTQGTAARPWLTLAVDTQTSLLASLLLTLEVLVGGGVVVALLGGRLWRQQSVPHPPAARRSPPSLFAAQPDEGLPAGRGRKLATADDRLQPASLPRVAMLVWSRLLRRSRLAAGVLVLAAGVAWGAPQAGVALALLLVVPILLLNGTSRAEVMAASSLENCEPALARPRPNVVFALVLLMGLWLVAMPALWRLDTFQALTAMLGMAALVNWLVLTHRHFDRPLLGVAVAGAAVYVVAFNKVPAGADIFGLWQVSGWALVISAGLACSLGAALLFSRPR
ncbi:MAG TPA: hypothetical protein VGM81_20805 [Burkholderiaceae bacterium]